MADGKIETQELKDQEARLIALMKKVEPELNDKLHEDVTHLLCELTAYNIMHTLHELACSTAQDQVPRLRNDHGSRLARWIDRDCGQYYRTGSESLTSRPVARTGLTSLIRKRRAFENRLSRISHPYNSE